MTPESLRAIASGYNPDGFKYRGIAPDLRSRHNFESDTPNLEYWISEELAGNRPHFRENFGRYDVALLNAESRLELAKASDSHDASRDTPNNMLQMLYRKKEIQAALNDVFFSTFNHHITFDYSGLAKLYLRVSQTELILPESAEDANPLLAQVPQLDVQGDGMRSFTAVVLSILLTENRIVLLDEPDAFLHPEQARRLGRWIADRASGDQQIVIATHNAHFLQGMVSSQKPPQIIRLNRNSPTTTEFKRMSNATVKKLGADPLLSSQRVVEAIFHSQTIVCEADSDRTIYQAVAAQELGNNQVLFVNAQNKQTCAKVVETLNDADIQARSVVDFDILRIADELAVLMGAHEVPVEVQASVEEARKEICAAIEETVEPGEATGVADGLRELADRISNESLSKKKLESAVGELLGKSKWSPVKATGVSALEPAVQAKASFVISALEGYGIWIVPVGELESWISLEQTKSKWVTRALEVIYAKGTPEPLKKFVTRLLAPKAQTDGASVGGAEDVVP
ncbi:hypothetical protein DSM43276_01034 [Mycobacteroides salmoniphilum]|nr:hypothetical protein DSM43276_01034 [Mycobacteroides salmoniphilum]